MSNAYQTEDHLRELLLKALDGEATPAELQSLNDMVRQNPELCRSAARFLTEDALLAEEIGTIEEASAFLNVLVERNDDLLRERDFQYLKTRPAGEANSLPADRHAALGRGTSNNFGAPRRVRDALSAINHHGLMIAAAASLLAIAFGWQYFVLMNKFEELYALVAVPDAADSDASRVVDNQGASKDTDTAPSLASIARVTGLSDCEWPAGEQVLEFGDELAPGQRLIMTKGVLQMTFNTGARVVVEGPVDFAVTAASEAVLTEGRVAAAVPRFARGYTILTPTAEVVDLGTEFGVDVDKSGASEVHVFDGDVVARPRGPGIIEGELIHARVDEAVHFDASLTAGRRIQADEQRFVRRLTPALTANELPAIPVTSDLALWLAADVMPGAELKNDAPVAVWPDILIGDNQFPDDACQFDDRQCPTWIRDDRDLPAVRFNGWSSYMATSPMATGDRQTMFVVCSPGPTSFAGAVHGGMLLKYGLNAPSLELTMLRERTPRGWVWTRTDNGSATNVGVVKGRSVAPLYPCIIAYTYDAIADHAELWINGVSQGAATAPNAIEQNSKRYLGSHAQPWYEAYFLGNMYEIITYDAALESAERDRVFQYLSTRYEIELGDVPGVAD